LLLRGRVTGDGGTYERKNDQRGRVMAVVWAQEGSLGRGRKSVGEGNPTKESNSYGKAGEKGRYLKVRSV